MNDSSKEKSFLLLKTVSQVDQKHDFLSEMLPKFQPCPVKFKDLVFFPRASFSPLDIRKATVEGVGHSGAVPTSHPVIPGSNISGNGNHKMELLR